jgi:hypothetical protein
LDFLRCVQCSCQFEYYVPLLNPMTLPMCGHSMCRKCINLLRNQSECPKDHVSFGMNPTPIDQLPVNYALLTLIHPSSKVNIEINYIKHLKKNFFSFFFKYSYRKRNENVLMNVHRTYNSIPTQDYGSIVYINYLMKYLV